MSDSNTNKNQDGEKAAKPKKMASKAKPKKPSMTPRQSQIRAETLIRGIDNSTQKIEKEMASIKAARKELPAIITGLSNAAISSSTAAKPAAKPATAKPAAAKPTAKPTAKKPAAKPAAKSAAKPAAKKAAAKKPASKPASAKKPAANRPTFKDAAVQILTSAGRPMSKADLRRAYIAQHGTISSQSVYGVLNKNADLFKVEGNMVSLAGKSKQAPKDDVDAFLQRVEKDQATAATA